MGDVRKDNTRVRTRDIPNLLHDAQLLTVEWKPELAQVVLMFDCLRRNADGSEMADRSVEIRLVGVHRIAAYYDPVDIRLRPSSCRLDDPFIASDLENWPLPPLEAFLAINSEESLFSMATSWRVDWLQGCPMPPAADRCALFIHLQINKHDNGETASERSLYFECDSIHTLSSGVPLDLDHWAGQFDAWWKSWEQHCQRGEGSDGEDRELVEEDAFIPSGEDPPQDLSYRPPDRTAFSVQRTGAPAALLQPIQDMHEAILDRNWARLARAWPNYDKNTDERARELEEQYLGLDFGRWAYVRQVDEWWEEGNQACVTVRGIEHSAPDDEDPATNQEVVITYALRKSDRGWRILTFSQGWPEYGSADSSDGPKPWLDEWL